MTKQIEINDHIYYMNGKEVWVKPYSKRFDVYSDPVMIGIVSSGFEFAKLIRMDAEKRQDPFKGFK